MNKKDLPAMYCLLVILLFFFFLALLHNHCYSPLHEPSEVSQEKDSREMPCLPRMAHKAPVMQASKPGDTMSVKDTDVCL